MLEQNGSKMLMETAYETFWSNLGDSVHCLWPPSGWLYFILKCDFRLWFARSRHWVLNVCCCSYQGIA